MNDYKTNYDKGYAYLENLADDLNEPYFEIVEDSYEYENGLILITYSDIEHEHEKSHFCIDLDNLNKFIDDKDEFWSIADCMREEGHTELDIIDVSQEDFKTTVFLDNETFEQDAVIDWLRENINIVGWSENGEAICNVSGFVTENYDLLQNFSQEHQVLARAMTYDDFNYNVELGVDCIKELFNGEFGYNAYDYLIDTLDLEVERNDEIFEFKEYDEER